jgi:molecular chaperone HtpG
LAKKTLQIHSQNILPIIKQWLYSDKDIFVRELISNAHDAIQKLKTLQGRGDVATSDEPARIDVTIDKEARTLVFSDNGIGMTADEVEKYIGEVAFSGAEEFVQKYEEHEQIIGHFGLGFFSSFMVAGKVEIDTLSHKQGAKPAHWSCDGSADYELEEGSRDTRGTTITLYLTEDSEEYLEPARIRTILEAHCAYLPVAIHLDDSLLPARDPLWMKQPTECTDEEYLDFYRQLYPMEPEPLFWIHLNVDFPFHLRGILYFPKLQRQFEENKNTIKLFCNRVFVSDNCKDLVPDYLTMLRGAIDSPDIPLNVSRSTLQMDRTVRQLSGHVAKKVCDRLVILHTTDRDQFLKCWEDIELIVKLGALQDEKFYERVKDALVWKQTNGEYTTLEGRNPVYYCGDQSEDSHFLQLYRDRGISVIQTRGPVDTHLISFLERKNPDQKFRRIDAAIDDAILDDKGGDHTALAALVKEALHVDVETKGLASDALPALVTIPEEERRMREFMAFSGQTNPFPSKRTLVLNTNSKLVQAIEGLYAKSPDLARDLMRQIYDGALMAQRELKPDELDTFLSRNHAVLEALALR